MTIPSNERKPAGGWIFGLLAAACIALAAFAYFAMAPSNLILAVEQSDDTSIWSAFANVLARERAPVRLLIKRFPDASAVLAALARTEAHLAIVRADRGVPPEARAVAKTQDNVLLLIARGDLGVDSPRDFTGRKIGLVGSVVGANQIAAVLRQYGVRERSWQTIAINSERLRVILKSKEIDVFAYAGHILDPAITGTVSAIVESGRAPTFITIELAEAFVQRNPLYETAEIPAGTFGGDPPQPPEAITTVSFAHYLVAAREVSEHLVGEITRRLFESRPQLVETVPDASTIAAPSIEKDATLPAHPGALAYFNNSERTFFERYGDWFYIAAMVGSVLVSIGAGVASYLRAARKRQSLSDG